MNGDLDLSTVDLTVSPPQSPTPGANGHLNDDPLTSISALATALDQHVSDVPSFLNNLLSPFLPAQAPGAPLKPPSDLLSLEKALNGLSTRLSLLNQDTSSNLEEYINDISRTVPRLSYDLQFMRESATTLQSSLSIVQAQASRQHPSRSQLEADGDSEEAKTYRSLENLAHLDKLKSRMEAARDILREAESWSTLEGEITGYIAESEWDKAGNRLSEASKSMVVFQSTPGEYNTRKTLLVSLQNELEGALAKALNEAIEKTDVEGCAKVREVFVKIDRTEEFKKYYFSTKRRKVVQEWNGTVLLDDDTDSKPETSTAGGVKFSTFISRWFTSLINCIQHETTQIPLIFPPSSATEIISSFLQDIFDDLSPSFQSRLSSVSDHHSALALPEIIRVYHSTEEMAINFQNILSKVHFNSQGGILSGTTNGDISALSPNPISPTPSTIPLPDKTKPRSDSLGLARATSGSHQRHFSRNPSTSAADIPGTATAQSPIPSEWETTILEPFLDLQSNYSSFERRYLTHLQRTDPSLSSASSSRGDASRSLHQRGNAAFLIAENAISRCTAFTHGYGFKGLLDAVGGYLENFLDDQMTKVLSEINAAAERRDGTGNRDELDLESLDYSTEDWGSFQQGLHILAVCRDLRTRLNGFEEKLHESVARVSVEVYNFNPSDPSTFKLGETTSSGAIALLQQSPLNSVDLHTLAGGLPLTPPQIPLLPAREALSSFTKHSQTFLQNIILSPLKARLATYPTLSSWTEPDKTTRPGDLHVPTFSLGPTDTIARVSEGLLNLLRVFEVYASDDALGFSMETLPFVDAESLREVMDEATAAHKAEDPTQSLEDGHKAVPVEVGLNAETVLSTWVSSLSLSLLSHLTKSVLPSIQTLSNPGAAQLNSDLGYLSNAVRALDVEWDDLEKWREAVSMKDESEWRNRFREIREGGEGGDGIWRRVGVIRGWS